MSRYNILYLHETAKLSGAEESLLNLTRKINKEEFNPIFVCPGKGLFSEKLKREGIKLYELTFPPVRNIIGILPTLKRISQIVRNENIHLFHSNSIRTHIYAAMLKKLEKIPLVWHERNLISKEIIDFDRLFSFLPDRIICNSYCIAKRFLKNAHLPEKARVIYNGVDTERFNPEIDSGKIRKEFGIRVDEIVVGICSRFNAAKDHETFFQAAKTLVFDMPRKIDKLRFLVVGEAIFDEDRAREKYLRDSAYRLGIGNKVIFTDFREDMPEVYAAMDIFVLASLAEPFGRVTIEAMASGKPVIATNSGGSPEIVRDGISGFLFNPKDANELASKIAFLANNLTLAKEMGQAGRKLVKENFDIEKKTREIEGVYLELIRK